MLAAEEELNVELSDLFIAYVSSYFDLFCFNVSCSLKEVCYRRHKLLKKSIELMSLSGRRDMVG